VGFHIGRKSFPCVGVTVKAAWLTKSHFTPQAAESVVEILCMNGISCAKEGASSKVFALAVDPLEGCWFSLTSFIF
jgi:hypothetical protein